MDLESWRSETPLFRPSSPTVRAESVAPLPPARRQARFLGDGLDSEDEAELNFAPRAIDALFELNGVTDEPDSKDAYDPLAKLKEGAEGEGDDASGQKKRPPRPKLDEDRLLGALGMPLLKQRLSKFAVKGKGKEHDDLGRLLSLYQLWAHQLFPRSNFQDAVETIEKLCHKRGMQRALKEWRTEQHGGKRRPRDGEAQDELAPEPEPEPEPAVPEPELRQRINGNSWDDVDEGDNLLDEALQALSSQAPAVDDYEAYDYNEEEAMMRELEGDGSRADPITKTGRAERDTEMDYDADAMEEIARMEAAEERSKHPTVDATSEGLLDGLSAGDLDVDF